MVGSSIAWHFFAVVGGLKIAYVFLPWVYWSLFCKININQFLYGYAVVTGASDGIGKAIAKELVKRGFKVILVSRSFEKLQNVKSELQSLYPTSTIEIIPADFSYSHRNPRKFYDDLHEKLSQFNISMLVNNVGVLSAKFLTNEADENIENMLGVNIYPSTFITHRLLPSFLQRHAETGQKSLVINVSSIIDDTIVPGHAIYAATKRYNAFFSEGLRIEYSGKVEFVTAKPGVTLTGMAFRNNGQNMPLSTDPDSYAAGLLGGLRPGMNNGHWKHRILGFFLNSTPYLMTVFFVRMALPSTVKKGLIS